jgi:hypothetical protein
MGPIRKVALSLDREEPIPESLPGQCGDYANNL